MHGTAPESPGAKTQIVLGFLLGVVASLLFLFLAMFLAGTLGPHRGWTGPLFEAIALVLGGALAFKNLRRSAYAVGMAIAFALTLVLDAAWAIGMLKWIG
jgi:hypothetical protein